MTSPPTVAHPLSGAVRHQEPNERLPIIERSTLRVLGFHMAGSAQSSAHMRPCLLRCAVAILHGSLRPNQMFFELVHTLYKLFLVGFAVLIDPGSILQLVIAMLIAIFFLVLVLYAPPYKQPTNNFFALCTACAPSPFGTYIWSTRIASS
eukprot:1789368-Prymnesium_polylepis.1